MHPLHPRARNEVVLMSTTARKRITAAVGVSRISQQQGGDRDPAPTELWWYFNEADGDVSGLRSSHESFVNACSGVTGSQGQLPEAYQESGRAMSSVREAHAVRATLTVIGEPHFGVLRAYYKQEKHGADGEHDDTFGEWAGVVLRARGNWPGSTADGKTNRVERDAAIAEARALVLDAHREYARMRGPVRRRLREEYAALMMGVRS